MDSSQPLSIESFSYSWLVNLKPSFESLDDFDEASFIEMDPKKPPSKRFFTKSQDFNFDFPISESPLTLVHADELISNGFLLPIFLKQLKNEKKNESSESVTDLPFSPPSSKTAKKMGTKVIRCSSLRMCRRLSKRIFQKYLDFLRPICQKMRGRRTSSGDEFFGAKTNRETERWVCSPAASPRASLAYCSDDWRRSCDSDSSIYEAVLHCKRTIGR